MFNLPVEKKEIERYLGYRGCPSDERTSTLIDECLEELCAVSEPRSYYRCFPIVWEELSPANPDDSTSVDGDLPTSNIIHISDMTIPSVSLSRNLSGCTEAVLFAATAGIGIDRVIRRYELSNITKAAICQATGAAMIEAYVDDLNMKIAAEARKRGLLARPRYSPGFGDVPLSYQKDFDRILSMQKNVGIVLSDSLLMTPSKSVTAIIGLYPE